MQQYAILRRNGWASGEELQGGRRDVRRKVGNEEMPDDIRWIRSYVLDEGGGSVGTVCIYEASSPEAIRKHASIADLPVDEIIAHRRHRHRAARSSAGGELKPPRPGKRDDVAVRQLDDPGRHVAAAGAA